MDLGTFRSRAISRRPGPDDVWCPLYDGGWHLHGKLEGLGHAPSRARHDRIRQIGGGQHKRKNEAIDAETVALAVEPGRLPAAHVLSPEPMTVATVQVARSVCLRCGMRLSISRWKRLAEPPTPSPKV